MTVTCPLHNVEMEEKTGQFGAYWSHKTEDGYCNGKRVKPFSFSPTPAPAQPGLPGTPPQPQPSPNGWGKNSGRIEQQHSQEMAIRYLDYCRRHQLDPMDAKVLKEVKDFTEVFKSDLDEIDLEEANRAVTEQSLS